MRLHVHGESCFRNEIRDILSVCEDRSPRNKRWGCPMRFTAIFPLCRRKLVGEKFFSQPRLGDASVLIAVGAVIRSLEGSV